jgi:hypothetical protein
MGKSFLGDFEHSDGNNFFLQKDLGAKNYEKRGSNRAKKFQKKLPKRIMLQRQLLALGLSPKDGLLKHSESRDSIGSSSTRASSFDESLREKEMEQVSLYNAVKLRQMEQNYNSDSDLFERALFCVSNWQFFSSVELKLSVFTVFSRTFELPRRFVFRFIAPRSNKSLSEL